MRSMLLNDARSNRGKSFKLLELSALRCQLLKLLLLQMKLLRVLLRQQPLIYVVVQTIAVVSRKSLFSAEFFILRITLLQLLR